MTQSSQHSRSGLIIMIKSLIIMINLLCVACGVAQASEDSNMRGPDNRKYGNPEPVFTGWSQGGRLIVGNPNVAVSMQAQFPVLDNYTVLFNLNAITVPPGTSRACARAQVSWRVAGNEARRLISVSDGTSITGTAEAVHVRLFDNTLGAPGPQEYAGSILIAKGTRGSNKQPPYLALNHATVIPGGNAVIAIPDDIGANSLFVSCGPSTLGTLVPDGSILVTVVGNFGITSYDPRNYDWVPLDPGAKTIVLTVAAAAGTNVEFAPYLGIDG
jgi:hypothetical protein